MQIGSWGHSHFDENTSFSAPDFEYVFEIGSHDLLLFDGNGIRKILTPSHVEKAGHQIPRGYPKDMTGIKNSTKKLVILGVIFHD